MEKSYFDTGLLKGSENRNISLYIHIPFCAAKCDYCDFFSVPFDRETAEIVLQEIVNQCGFYLEYIRAEKIETLYFGGGTPSVIQPEQMYRFIQKLYALFPNKPEEVTIETNPESLTTMHLDAYREAGVSRISVGVQSIQGASLELLGRPGTGEDNLRALSMLHSHWKGDLNVDLLCGIPGESIDNLEKTIRTLLGYNPGHISLYTLTVHDGTALRDNIANGVIIPKEENELLEEWRAGINILLNAGYERYEVSNFALPDNQCRHNLRYWRLLSYLGCGPGACSTIFSDNLPVRIETAKEIQQFCAGRSAANGPWSASVSLLDANEYLLEYLLMGLRLKRGIVLQDFKERFGSRLLDLLLELSQENEYKGLLAVDDEKASCTEGGIEILDTILVRLVLGLEKYEQLTPHFSI